MVVDSTFATPLRQQPLDPRGDGRHPQRHQVHRRPQRPDDRAVRDRRRRRPRAPRRRPDVPGRDARRARGVPRPPRAAHAAGAPGRVGAHRGRARRPVARPPRRRGRRLSRAPARWCRSSAAAGAPAADAVCDTVRVLVPATSLGGVETTIERRQKYAGDAHVPPGLLRMSVGLEDVDDLWADLDRALRALTAASIASAARGTSRRAPGTRSARTTRGRRGCAASSAGGRPDRRRSSPSPARRPARHHAPSAG